MTHLLERDALLQVIERCTWLIQYYERSDASPETIQSVRDAMNRAISKLEALRPDAQPQPTSPHESLDTRQLVKELDRKA